MKGRWFIGLLLLAGLLVSCKRDLLSSYQGPKGPEPEPTLGIAIDFPLLGDATKDAVGELPASDLENALHSLTVWVFRSDNHSLVAARALTEEEFPLSGGVRRYSLEVSREFVTEMPNVDVFVLGNAASIGVNLDENSDWDDLNDAFFGDTGTAPYYGFGLAHPVHEVDENLGLPMSGCGKDLPVEGEEPVLKVRTVKIKRAVSRLRFVFCKTRTEGEEQDVVSISRIILGQSQIPLKEYVFTNQENGVVLDQEVLADNYVGSDYIVPGPATIAENDTPESLIYVNQDALTYEALLDDAVEHDQLTDLGYTYFRESDRRLNGRIEYTVNGRDRVREFNMVTAGDFSRNRTWTVFGYFLSGRNLQLALNVLPWDYNSFLVDFSEESVNVSSKFVVDENTVELIETSKDHYDAYLLPGVAAKGHLNITTPVGGHLMIRSIGDASAFQVEPDIADIDPTVNNGRIDILIRRNPDIDENLTGRYITLSFTVESGDRVIDANTEIVDAVYKFII